MYGRNGAGDGVRWIVTGTIQFRVVIEDAWIDDAEAGQQLPADAGERGRQAVKAAEGLLSVDGVKPDEIVSVEHLAVRRGS